MVSTLGVFESFVPGRARLDPRAMEMLAPEARREVESTNAQLAVAAFNVPERLLTKMMRWERDFVDAGGLLGAGSDPWGTGFLPGFGNLRNYELLVEAGFAPEQAIGILTLNGARILGEEERIGSIVAGKAASNTMRCSRTSCPAWARAGALRDRRVKVVLRPEEVAVSEAAT